MGIRTVLIAAAAFAPALAISTTLSAQVAGQPATAPSAVTAPEAQQKEQSIRQSGTSVRAPVRREVAPKPRRVVKQVDKQTDKQIGPAATDGGEADVGPLPAPTAVVVAQAAVPSRKAATSAPPVPQTVPAPPPSPAVSSPGASPSAPTWTADEIQQAKAHCAVVLRGVDATLVPDEPIKEGECGSPVVYKVSGIGKGPVIELSPPVTLTCEMVASLDKWIKRDVQPQARTQLGGSVIKIDTMSSYSCRNAYGRARAKLSEHGKANAIDIGAFHTAKDVAVVLNGWGPTIREQKAIAVKKESAPVEVTGSLPRVIGPPSAANTRSSPPLNVPGVVITGPGGPRPPGVTGLGLAPHRLGGPKTQEGKGPPVVSLPADADPRRRILHEIHAAACKHFGTVLGPEANNAHKNHFHLDMAPRKLNNFCE